MKQKRYAAILYSCLFVAMIAFACGKSFLDKKPLGQLTESSVANKAGLQALLIGAYSFLDGQSGLSLGGTDVTGITYGAAGSNWVYGSIVADDSYKGSTPSDQPPMVFWLPGQNPPQLPRT